jgi:hypothetical protein
MNKCRLFLEVSSMKFNMFQRRPINSDQVSISLLIILSVVALEKNEVDMTC